jgi:hypothetical protein
MTTIRAAIASVLLVACAFAAQGKGYDLVWKPKAGESHIYRLSLKASVESSEILVTGDLHYKVKKVEPSGDYTLESQMRNGRLTFMGEEMPIGDEEDVDVQRYNARGELIDMTTADEDGSLERVFQQVCDFVPPSKAVKVGDEWESVIKADSKANTPAATNKYKVLQVETVGGMEIVKIKATYSQSKTTAPVSAESTFTIAASTGVLIRCETDVKNLQLDKDMPPTTAHITLEERK